MASFRQTVETACAPYGLTVLGIAPGDPGSVALIGMAPEAWPIFTQSIEFKDGFPDPLDRWSMMLMPELASELGAREVVYPFTGPPYAPFIRWMQLSGEAVSSPFGMLWHHRAGFWISLRGALIFEDFATDILPEYQYLGPEKAVCPVDALTPDAPYDVAACKGHLATKEGRDCLEAGCRVRRACAVSHSFGRDPEQSAFHMAAFVGN